MINRQERKQMDHGKRVDSITYYRRRHKQIDIHTSSIHQKCCKKLVGNIVNLQKPLFHELVLFFRWGGDDKGAIDFYLSMCLRSFLLFITSITYVKDTAATDW